MQWQDIALSVVSILLSCALIPTLRGSNKPALSSAILITSVIYFIAFIYMTLNLWFSVATTVVNATCWAVIAVQCYRQRMLP